MLTSMAGAAKEATAKVDAAIILSMVVFSLDIFSDSEVDNFCLDFN